MLFKQTLQVRDHSSFRWLQALHEFDEELDIVRGVLLQQERVLTTFCNCLDPESFKRPNLTRKMSFVFSRNHVERVLLSIRDQFSYCAELKGKCSMLVGQNIQLVQAMRGTSLRMGVGRLFDQAVHGSSKVISRHLPSRRTPADIPSTRNDVHMGIAPSEDDTPDPIKAPPQPLFMTDQQQSEVLIKDTPKRTLSEQVDAYFQQNHLKDKQDFLASILDLLWQHFPERKDLEGKISNPDDPGDGFIYDQPQVQEAKSILLDLYNSWSAAEIRRGLPRTAPRLPELAKICLILSGMRQYRLLEEFLNSGYTDAALPLSKTVLESILKPEHRSYATAFSTEQYRAVPRPWAEGVHLEVANEEPLPLKVSMVYDSGSFGMVSRVSDAFTNKTYARKEQIVSPKISQARAAKRHLQEEVLRLKSINHKHIVQFVKSYQRGELYGILLKPAATTDLSRLLKRYAGHLTENNVILRPALLTAFGCLSQGLAHIHGAKIRHKDIKPSNILYVAGTGGVSANFLWADFGLAYDFSTSSESRTNDSRIYSRRYAAPELVDHDYDNPNSSLSIGLGGHGRSADVFSLGCVFLEMLACLVRKPLPLDEPLPLDDNTTGDSDAIPTFYNHLRTLRVWVHRIMNRDSGLKPLFIIAEKMIDFSARKRPTIDQVVQMIISADQKFFCDDCLQELLKQRRASTPNLLLQNPTAMALPRPDRSMVDTLEVISETMTQRYTSSSISQTATFIISWDLQKYLQQELEIDQDSLDTIHRLRNVLTITGTANEAYATTLEDYMSWKWGDARIDFQSIFRSAIGRDKFGKCFS